MNKEHPSILVIDDEEYLRKTLMFLLEMKGYQVKEAMGGKQAKDQIHQQNFDLVLLDLKLPDINGLDLLSEIMKEDPSMPVIVLSAQAQINYAIDAIRRGAVDYMIKPANPESILTRAEEVLSAPKRSLSERDIDGEVKRLLDRLEGE